MDVNLKVSSENDGPQDCQPIVYSRCNLPLVRNSIGACVDPAAFCVQVCGVLGGTLGASTGTCDCNDITPLFEVCDKTCRASAATAGCVNGKIVVFNPGSSNVTTSMDPSSLSTQGTIDCSVSGSQILSMDTSSGFFQGIFGLGASLGGGTLSRTTRRLFAGYSRDEYAVNSSYQTPPSVFLVRNHVKLQNTIMGSSNNYSTPVISNPLVCIKVGDSILFDISTGFYPVYVKDSLLNTNQDFDFSSFRELESIASRNVSITTFAFTFTQNGTYVFSVSSQSVFTTIITVLPSSLTCTTEAPFVDFTTKNLVTMGVASNTSIVLSPDWYLIMGLLFGMMGLIVFVVGFLYYFRKRAWSTHSETRPRFPSLNKLKPGQIFSKSNPLPGLKKSKVAPMEEGIENGELDRTLQDIEAAKIPPEENIEFDDEMQVPELARHIQTHHDEIGRRLIDQNDLLEGLHASLKREVDELKSLLTASAAEMGRCNGLESSKDQKLLSVLTKMKSDLNVREAYESSQRSTVNKVLQQIEHIQKLLNAGAVSTARDITLEIKEVATSAHQYELPVSALESTSLHALIAEVLCARSYIIDHLLPAVGTEKRRAEGAEQSFNNVIHNITGDTIPSGIITAFHSVLSSNLTTDSVIADFVYELKTFSDKSSIFFVDRILSEEKLFTQTLAVDFEKGLLSAVESDRMAAEDGMAILLEELRKSVEGLLNFSQEKAVDWRAIDPVNEETRRHLIALIDPLIDELSSEKQPFDMSVLSPLIEALKESQALAFPRQKDFLQVANFERNIFPSNPYDDDDEEEREDDNDRDSRRESGQGAIQGIMSMESSPDDEENSLMPLEEIAINRFDSVDKVVIQAVMNSDLSSSQKEEILESAESGTIVFMYI